MTIAMTGVADRGAPPYGRSRVNRLRARMVSGLVVVFAAAALCGLMQPAAAQAYTIQGPAQLGWGRAAVLFDRNETQKISFGIAPGGLPPTNPAAAAFMAARMGIAAIAGVYYRQGLCSAWLFSARPWDPQGFKARRC